MLKKGLNGIIIGMSSLSILIWIFSFITPLEISDLLFKKMIAFISLAGTTYILICLIIFKNYKNLRLIFSLLLILIIGVNIHKHNWNSEWKTYKVHFKNNHFKNKCIETQIRFSEEWKTNDRLVKITRLNKYFWIAQNVDTSQLDSDWKRNIDDCKIKM